MSPVHATSVRVNLCVLVVAEIFTKVHPSLQERSACSVVKIPIPLIMQIAFFSYLENATNAKWGSVSNRDLHREYDHLTNLRWAFFRSIQWFRSAAHNLFDLFLRFGST